MKKLFVLSLALALVLTLAACGCEHEWAPADCVNPSTCSLCGETEGAALGHVWMAATCEEPKTCEVCAVTDGAPKGHSMVEAACEEPAHCENCSLTEGEALGHTWLDATTEAPMTCETCGATEGERIITDSRFTTAATAELQGKWAMEVAMTGEMMGIPDFPGEAKISMILLFGNDGDMDVTVEVTEDFTDALVQYSVELTYAELAAQGLDKESADAAFESMYGMSIHEYMAEEMASVDLNEIYASLFEALDIGGVYYVADDLIYAGSSWEDTMDPSEYTLEGDTLMIQDFVEGLVEGGLDSESVFVRVTEE